MTKTHKIKISAETKKVTARDRGPAAEKKQLNYDFFFSSRRRHTRCGRDWSSDVCSSDLGEADQNVFDIQQGVSISALVRTVGRGAFGRLRRADLWGLRQFKYQALLGGAAQPRFAAIEKIGRASCRERGKSAAGERTRKRR